MATKQPLKRRPVYLVIMDYSCGQDIEVYSTLPKAQKRLKYHLERLIKEGDLSEKPSVLRKRFKENNKTAFSVDKKSDYDTCLYTIYGSIQEKPIW